MMDEYDPRELARRHYHENLWLFTDGLCTVELCVCRCYSVEVGW